MSRTRKTERAPSPVLKNYFINARKGTLSYIEEQNDGTSEFVVEEMPMSFVVLDDSVYKVSGRHPVSKERITSTKGRYDIPVTVKSSEGKVQVAQGLWRDIKEEVKLSGGKYTLILYVMDMEGNILALFLKGMALAAWLTYTKKVDATANFYFQLTGFEEQKTDDGIEVYVPQFTHGAVSKEETLEMANRSDGLLQEYLDAYFESSVKGVDIEEQAKEERKRTNASSDEDKTRKEWLTEFDTEIKTVETSAQAKELWDSLNKKINNIDGLSSDDKTVIMGMLQQQLDDKFGAGAYAVNIDGTVEDDLPF